MAILTIRNIDETLKAKLKVMAAQHGFSMKEQTRQIIREAVLGKRKNEKGLGSRIHQRFAKVGGIDIELPTRSLVWRAIDFSD